MDVVQFLYVKVSLYAIYKVFSLIVSFAAVCIEGKFRDMKLGTYLQIKPNKTIFCFLRLAQNLTLNFSDEIMHQSFVTTATPPKGKGGDYDFSLEVKTLIFAPPFAIEYLPGVRILMSKPHYFPCTAGTLEK